MTQNPCILRQFYVLVQPYYIHIMKRAAFIGRYQPFHNGHVWLINQKLAQGIPVLILVRETPITQANPFTIEQTVTMIEEVYRDQNVVVQTIPDIESINYGRGVGYDVLEHVPPKDIGSISATGIRDCLRKGDESWKRHVSVKIHHAVAAALLVDS